MLTPLSALLPFQAKLALVTYFTGTANAKGVQLILVKSVN